MSLPRLNAPALALAAGLAIVAADVADARVGGGKSFGSRGTKTYIAPPATKTAPSAAPIERSMTDRRAPTVVTAPPSSRVSGWRSDSPSALISPPHGNWGPPSASHRSTAAALSVAIFSTSDALATVYPGDTTEHACDCVTSGLRSRHCYNKCHRHKPM